MARNSFLVTMSLSYYVTSSPSAPVSHTPRHPPQPAPQHHFPVYDTSYLIFWPTSLLCCPTACVRPSSVFLTVSLFALISSQTPPVFPDDFSCACFPEHIHLASQLLVQAIHFLLYLVFHSFCTWAFDDGEQGCNALNWVVQNSGVHRYQAMT